MKRQTKPKKNKIKEWLKNHPASFYLIGAVLVSIILICLNLLDKEFSFHDILVEAHGLWFDLLVFGILLTIYDSIRTKRERIERYKEEIRDFSNWKDKEASIRIASNLRRLNKYDVHDLDLTNCNIEGVNLKRINISNSNIVDSNFSETDLSEANLNGCWGEYAKFEKTNFEKAKLGGWFFRATFDNANMRHANLNNSGFQEASLNNVDLSFASMLTIDLIGTSMKGTKLYKTKINELQRKQLIANGVTEKQLNEIDWIKKEN